jgi:valyl-tRNA synthetase
MQRWILSRLNHCIQASNKMFHTYHFAEGTSALYSFWLYELCDVYLESMKPLMQKFSVNNNNNSIHEGKEEISGEEENLRAVAREILYTCLDNGLRLLHPLMPFVTEELWQRLPRRQGDTTESICIASYPAPVAEWSNPQAESDTALVQSVIHAARSLRTSFNLTKQKPALTVFAKLASAGETLVTNAEVILFLGACSALEVVDSAEKIPKGCAVEIVSDTLQVLLHVKGLVNFDEEISKLVTKMKKLTVDHQKLTNQMAEPNYLKVPENKKAENAAKSESLQTEIAAAEKAIASFQSLKDEDKK